MTAATLKTYTLRDLTELAKKRGVQGWHAMKKDQLVTALVKVAKSQAAKAKQGKKPATALRRSAAARPGTNGTSRNGTSRNGTSRNGNGAASSVRRSTTARQLSPAEKARGTRARRRLEEIRAKLARSKNLAPRSVPGRPNGYTKDRLIVMVRDPYWLHAYWELTRHGVERAAAALGELWHEAKPVLRLLEVARDGTTNTAETVVRNIEIHGGVSNWYVDVHSPPKTYRLDIGYLAANGRFYSLVRSNVVSTPEAEASDTIDHNWSDVAKDYDKIYALSGGYSHEKPCSELQELFEERLRRPMGSPMLTRYGLGANGSLGRKRDFELEVNAELIVFGSTAPDAHVTLRGEPVRLRPDGTFTMRFSLPNCRQVIPTVASSADGVEQRTIVLSVERNTKTMEPIVRDPDDCTQER
ncbi:MAG: DUF4912 domain-containing protein [Pirellulales bacterium]